MKKEWEVDSRGKKHTVVYETGRIAKVTVDNSETELKSQTAWLNYIDHHMWVGHEDAHLVVVGKKVRLALNGEYLEDGGKYEPLKPMPKSLGGLVFFCVVGGALVNGVVGGLAGILFGTFYAKAASKYGKIGMYIAFFLSILLQMGWFVFKNR